MNRFVVMNIFTVLNIFVVFTKSHEFQVSRIKEYADLQNDPEVSRHHQLSEMMQRAKVKMLEAILRQRLRCWKRFCSKKDYYVHRPDEVDKFSAWDDHNGHKF